MNTHRSRLDAAADRLLSLDSPVYGDEREQRVTLEACSFAWTLGVFGALLVAVWCAVTGAVVASIAFVLFSVFLGATASWYARRRNVDFNALARRDLRLYRIVMAVHLFTLAAWCAALAFHGFVGRPLLTVPAWPTDVTGGSIRGMAVGGVIGGVIGGIVQLVLGRRAERRVDGVEPDDEF